MDKIDFWVNFFGNILTIFASSIAIYVFFFNKEKIVSAINVLLSYSTQLTLTDLKYKIERLNDFNANFPEQKLEIINILHEIEGQILGNNLLKEKLEEQLKKIENFTKNTKSISEPKKRSLVSELRESVRNMDVNNLTN
ncbi:hypothetical protein [Empedobacter falsenii]